MTTKITRLLLAIALGLIASILITQGLLGLTRAQTIEYNTDENPTALHSNSVVADAPVSFSQHPLADSPQFISSAPFDVSNGDAFLERFFQVNDEPTYGYSVFPVSDGYLVINRHDERHNFTKLNHAGEIVLSKDIYCDVDAWPHSAARTADGGYLIGGTRNTSPQTGYVLKLDSNLGYQWGKALSVNSHGWSIVRETTDGGYIALVREYSGFGIAKLDASGNLLWAKRIFSGGSGDGNTDLYDIYENTYLDGTLTPQCGGYVIYGSIYRPTTDRDLYLAGISCDGNSILWQRTIGGSSWDGSYTSSFISPYSSNILVISDTNSINTQNTNLAVAATTGSYGVNNAVMLIPFNVSGGTTLSNPPTIGSVKALDGLDSDYLVGPYGGPNFLRLYDGNVLLGGTTYSFGSGSGDVFLAKMDPKLDVIWEYAYGTSSWETHYGLSETITGTQVVGYHYDQTEGDAAFLMQISQSGENEGSHLTRSATNFTMTVISPTVYTPTYTLDSGTLTASDLLFTVEDVTAKLVYPIKVFLPLVLRSYTTP